MDEYSVKPIRLIPKHILPVAIDNSMSYYEAVAKVTQKINEVIDAINKIDPSSDWSDYLKKKTTEGELGIYAVEGEEQGLVPVDVENGLATTDYVDDRISVVEPNAVEAATQELEKVKINDVNYEVGHTEEWTFTLDDDTTVTKNVVVR